MKRLLIFLIIAAGCTSQKLEVRKSLSLAGIWKFRIDSLDRGRDEEWYNTSLPETIRLPGSMAENGKGDEVTLTTDWTGDIVDRSYFTEKRYEKYRQPGNIKIPFWLKPVRYYKGVAWYQKEFELPSSWRGRNIVLFLERPHWETTLYINGKPAGSENSLAVPHQYPVTALLKPGKNIITIRIDNRVIIPIGVNSHSISDHTQTDWNGITGDISLKATSEVFIRDVQIYPDITANTAKVVLILANSTGAPFKGKVILEAESFNSGITQKLKSKIETFSLDSGTLQMNIDYPMGDKVKLWNEFTPSLYKLTVDLKGHRGDLIDQISRDFGMREFRAEGTRFAVNGHKVFLRGTLECCIFPLTGYPPTDVKSWHKVLQTCREYGLNNIRFHSWCPPEAAFTAADKLGLYLQVECSSWANQGTGLGEGSPVDSFIYRESDKIMEAYGNHPSFCMLAYGNEPAGKMQNEYLGQLLKYWKAKDNRRVYTSAAGWPFIPENDYNLSPEPRIQHWGEGLKSIINAEPPQTMFDYRGYISKYSIPVVGHEVGQWCVYPDFREIPEYTGVLKPTNLEIFRETLRENEMGDQADDFVKASGKLQVLCYKADIEAALRTPGFAGFQLLQLHDFPGQGTALVGILNPFFESKGYVTPEEFRMFCNQTVPLARIQKMVYRNNETFKADIEMAHFGAKPLIRPVIACEIKNEKGEVVNSKILTKDVLETGNCIPAGSISMDLSSVSAARKLTLIVTVENTPFKNSWDFWVYPAKQEIVPGDVLITDKLDKKAEEKLKEGGPVLLLTYGLIGKDEGAQVATGFSTIFWNTAWTNNQPPHTMGILCNPGHPLFKNFPTEYHTNWQWWDPVSHSEAMILDGFPSQLRPLIQPIDTWFENRRLALAFETRTDGGKLFVCSIDLKNDINKRPVSKQLLISILNYMNSNSFDPVVTVDSEDIKKLIAN
jgi:Glycosyl hydrolases family 2, sugar binding domain/Glycosyl hydrolases family 2